MRLRDVLKQVIVKLDMESDVPIDDKVVGGDKIKKLLLAGNNIIRELASSYLPLVARESVRVEDNRLDISTLQRRAIKILSLKSGETNVRYKMYPTYMYAQNGVYDIEYSYLPNSVNLDDEIECDMRVNEDILANGIISEYALMTGDIDKGQTYDKRYRENLKNIAMPKREIKIKERAFI